jgi:hypothetical protein
MDDVGGIRGGNIRLGHQVGGADFAVEQRFEPLLLVFGVE